MSWIRTIIAELIAIFVDDERFAVAIVAWLAGSWLVLPRLPVPSWLAAVLFVAGLIAILVESAARRAGKAPPQ